MSLNVLNQRFLSLLNSIGVDIDVFQDKSFDGLFERRQNELNFFLEWFVNNISVENVLTEGELDIYEYLKACNSCLTVEELNFALLKCSPSYEELELLDENYIENCLSEELEEINVEYEKILNIKSDLEKNYDELKKKPNHLKEECHRTKKKLEEVRDDLLRLNLDFNFMNEDINDFKLKIFNDMLDLSKFKSLCEKEERLVEQFSVNNFQCNETIPFEIVKSDEIAKLKTNLGISKYCSLVSKGLLEEVKYKIFKAEEFLNTLKDESETHFTFEEVLGVWFDSNEMIAHDNLVEEVNSLELKDLTENLDKECELIWHHFLSQLYYHKLCENNGKVSKYVKFMKHIKLDLVYNSLMQLVLNKSKEKEKELADLINEFHCMLHKNQNNIKSDLDSIACRNNKAQDYYRNMKEKHALLVAIKKIGSQEDFENSLDAVKLLCNHPSFYSAEFFDKLEREIASKTSDIFCGPTNQLQMTPIELQWEFSKCDKTLAENSHAIQRLLTEYVNTKESISADNRRQLLLWIDFLTNPDFLAAGLEELEKKSLKFTSTYSDSSKS